MVSYPVLIFFYLTSPNQIQNLFFPTKPQIHTSTSFLELILLPWMPVWIPHWYSYCSASLLSFPWYFVNRWVCGPLGRDRGGFRLMIVSNIIWYILTKPCCWGLGFLPFFLQQKKAKKKILSIRYFLHPSLHQIVLWHHPRLTYMNSMMTTCHSYHFVLYF